MGEVILSESLMLRSNLFWNLWFAVWGWMPWQKLQKYLVLRLDLGSLSTDVRNLLFRVYLIHILLKKILM